MAWNFHCPDCKREKDYDLRWDAYYCKKCDKWFEDTCNDVSCIYCVHRPDKPSLLKY